MAIGYPRVIDIFEDIYNSRKIQRAQRNAEHPESMGYIIPYIRILDKDINIEGIFRVSKDDDDRLIYVIYGKSSIITTPVFHTLNFVTGDYISIIMADNVIDEENIKNSINNLMYVYSKITPPDIDCYTKHINVMRFICSLYIINKIDVEVKDKMFKVLDFDHKSLVEKIFDEFYGDHYDLIYELQMNQKLLKIGKDLLDKIRDKSSK